MKYFQTLSNIINEGTTNLNTIVASSGLSTGQQLMNLKKQLLQLKQQMMSCKDSNCKQQIMNQIYEVEDHINEVTKLGQTSTPNATAMKPPMRTR